MGHPSVVCARRHYPAVHHHWENANRRTQPTRYRGSRLTCETPQASWLHFRAASAAAPAETTGIFCRPPPLARPEEGLEGVGPGCRRCRRGGPHRGPDDPGPLVIASYAIAVTP